MSPGKRAVANDALLAQLVRGELGQAAETRYLPRPNVSACKFIVTLHGCVRRPEERRAIKEVVRRVPGVRGVVDKIQSSQPLCNR